MTTGDDCRKSDSKEERLRALRVDEAIDCQQGKAKRSHRGFLTVAIGVIIIVLLLVLFGREGVFILFFVLHVFLSRVECSRTVPYLSVISSTYSVTYR